MPSAAVLLRCSELLGSHTWEKCPGAPTLLVFSESAVSLVSYISPQLPPPFWILGLVNNNNNSNKKRLLNGFSSVSNGAVGRSMQGWWEQSRDE